MDDNFTLDELKKSFRPGVSIVHIASHFNFDNTKKQSYLLLGDGKHITVYDMNFQLTSLGSIDLLTLSACDTATGIASGNGVEVESLGNTTLNKGVMAVLTTLWPVNDLSTSVLLADFYSLRYVDSLSKTQALKTAQVNLINNIGVPEDFTPHGVPTAAFGSIELPKTEPWTGEGFSHPYYWAPFVLMGNWR